MSEPGPPPAEEPEDPEVSADAEEPGDPRRYPSTIGGALYLAILLASGAGLLIVVVDDWRLGVKVISAALGTAGLLRLLLPQRDAGMLAVRHRLIDVLLLVGVALALYFLAVDIPDQPPL